MLPITYYFWNSYKKSGYVRGKLDRNEYDKRVSKGGKDSNAFVKKLVDSVLEDQAKTVNDNITTLEIQYNNADKELKRIQSLKDEEENKTSVIFENKKKILEQEKSKIEEDFENNTLLEAQQLRGAKNILKNLVEFLQTYAEEVKKGVSNQGERLLQQRKLALKHNTKVTAQEIKENILQKDNKEKNNEEKNKKELGKGNITGKSLGYLIILGITCIFDIFLGYVGIVGFLRKSITQERAAIALGLFLATALIPLVMAFIHALTLGKREGKISKGLGSFMIVFIIFLLVLYACQSVGKSDWEMLQNFTLGNFVNVLQKNPEFLLRCFIIPGLFAGEVIIDLINWDYILDYFGIGKRKGPNSLSKLITNGLYFLKSRKISSYAKEEKKAIDNLLNEMQKEEIPAFTEIKKDIREVQSILDPIWDKQAEKQEEFNRKITTNKNKMDNVLKEYNANIQEIEKKYAPEIDRLENIKKINEIKINKLTHDLNQASIDVKEGILIGLIDK